MEWVARWVNQ
jgi:hypothetical protein